MAIEVGIWRIDSGPVRRVNAARLEAEKRLEDVLSEDISILGLPPVLVLDRQIVTDFGAFIDILAIDAEGAVYVIELKRDKTPREVVAQALDYGSWVVKLGAEQIATTFESGRFANGRTFADAFADRFGAEPETINETHRLIIVATELDASTERIVEYLADVFGVPINAVFFGYFRDGTAEYLARSWLRAPSDTERRPVGSKRVQEPWNGTDFYVSFGEDERRDWEDAREFGFVSAGGGTWYSQSLSGLKTGHRVFVHLPGRGYVGVGEVTDRVKPAREFRVTLTDGQEVPVLDAPLRAKAHGRDADNPELAEHFVRVAWIETVPREQALKWKGMFANQNSACRLRKRATLERLYDHFRVESAYSDSAEPLGSVALGAAPASSATSA
jgi:hypothetical protein